MITGKQKLYFLLNRIDDAKAIAPSGQPILVHPLGDLKGNYPDLELLMLFKKLQDDEKVLKVVRTPLSDEEKGYNSKYEDDYYGLELFPTFDDYFARIQSEPEYQEFSGRKPAQQPTLHPIKPSRKALEKIWNILLEVENKRNITLEGDDISIPQVHLSKVKNEREANEAADERLNILRKLEKEENAITDVRWSHNHNEFVYLKLGNRYFDVLKAYEKSYKEAARDYQRAQQEEESPTKGIVYEITFLPTREILLNKVLQLAKPDFESENEAVFSFLYEHPNETYKQKELEVELKRSINKSLHKIVENLGFEGDLKKVFFDVSKDSICFKNPITKQDLDRLGLIRIKLPR